MDMLDAAKGGLESLDKRAAEVAASTKTTEARSYTQGEQEAQEEVNSADERLHTARQQHSKMKTQRSERCNTREAELSQLRTEAERVQTKIENEQQQLKHSQPATATDVESSSKDASAEHTSMQQMQGQAKSLEHETNVQLEEASSLANKAAECEEELLQLQQQREEYERRISDSAQDAQAQAQTDRDAYEDERDINAQVQEELALEQGRVAELERSLEQRWNNVNRNTSLRQQLEQVQRELTSKREQAESVQREKESLERKISRLKQQQPQVHDDVSSYPSLLMTDVDVFATSSRHVPSNQQPPSQRQHDVLDLMHSSAIASWHFVCNNAYARSFAAAYVLAVHLCAFLLLIAS